MEIGGIVMAEKKIPIICHNAGHGGYDSGAVCFGRREEDDVLKLALEVGAKLEDKYVCDSVYTRTTDIYESPSKMAQDSNEFDADLFVSYHRNSATPTGHGYETLVFENIGIKKELADKLNARMEAVGFKNRGTKIRKNLTVLKKTDAPAVLLEVGFISSAADNRLFDSKFSQIVDAIVLSIAEVMDLEKKPVPKPSEPKPSLFKNGNYNNKVRTTANLNVRAGRGTDYKILGTLPKGTVVKALYILSKDGVPWASIDYGKNVGFISMKYVEPVE